MENNRQTPSSVIWLILVIILWFVPPFLIISRLPDMKYTGLISVMVILVCYVLSPIISYFIVLPFRRLYEKHIENKESRSPKS